MNPHKSPLKAFLLSFIPGLGHAYLDRPVRALLYGGGFFGPIVMLLLLGLTNNLNDEMAVFFIITALLFGAINVVDMLITLISGPSSKSDIEQGYTIGSVGPAGEVLTPLQRQERTRTLILSVIPGFGHMLLGFMLRGITLLISFVGLLVIVVFLSVIMNRAEVLIFLCLLPIIWAYSLFDVLNLLNAKHRGEQLDDRSVFEELERSISSGKKSKVLAIALSVFPGAGHLYLGLQRRGLQLMGGFLLAIYIMDNMRLTLFLFLLPLFWCFTFFDGFQQASRYEQQGAVDEPIMKHFVPYQKWFGVALLGFGIYFLLDRFFSQYAQSFSKEMYEMYLDVKYMLPTAIASFIMITIGFRLVFGTKEKQGAANHVQSAENLREEEVQ